MTSTLSRALKHAAAFTARLETAAGITPRTLYLSRNVLNAAEVAAHYANAGLGDLKPELFHVTVAYSKTPVNWMKVGNDYYGDEAVSINSYGGRVAPGTGETFPPGSMIVAGGPRLHERFGPEGKENALVLIFADSGLKYRNERVRDIGGSWDFPDYIPHITIAYDEEGKIDWSTVKPYAGRIVFGPEVWAEVDEDWKEKNYSDDDLVKAEVEEAKSMQWFMFKGAATSLDGSNTPLDNGDSFGVIDNTIYLNNPKGGKMIKIAVDAARVKEIMKQSEKAKGNMAFGKRRGVTAALEAASTQIDPRRSGIAAALAAVQTIDPEANYCVQPDGTWAKEGSARYDCRAEPIKGKDLPQGAECAAVKTSWADHERASGVRAALGQCADPLAQ